MKKRYRFHFPLRIAFLLLAAFCLGRPAAQITVNATVGTASASYASFNAAIAAINAGTHKGSIRLRVHTSVVETAATSLEASGATSSSYTALLITPADTATVTKTISINITGAAVFILNGADNVTIDGRPNATGTANLLNFYNPNNVTASHSIVITNAATRNTLQYCTVSSASSGTIACSAIRLTTGANNRNDINHCIIDGGNLGIEINGTNGTPNDSTNIFANRIINQKATAVRMAAGVGRTVIDSNIIYHTTPANTSGYQCYNISQVETADTVFIYRTRAYDIQTSVANFIHGIFLSPSVASGTIMGINNSFVLGTGTYPNTLSQAIRGVLFTGTLAVNLVLENNTIRVGGTHVTANGNPTSLCMQKTNTSVASVFTFRNNLCINTRTGSTSQHVGISVASPTAGTNTIDYNTYKGSSMQAYWISTLYSDLAAYRTAASPQEQNSVFGMVDFLNEKDPDIDGGSVNATVQNIVGNPSTITTDILGNARSSTAPSRGAFEHTFNIWDGITWSNGTPTSAVNATIASSTAPASFTCKALFINSGVALTTTGITATVNGNIVNNGNGIAGTGNLTIAANSSILGNAINFNGALTVNSGATLTTNNLLTLTSTATNTARVANSAGAISGNVTVQRYIPGGRRVFRFLAHPFSSNLALDSLTDNIDITGSGGTPFTTTGSNAPSAFGYDNATSNSSLAADPGWTALTASSTLSAKAGYRFLVRGAKGEGLTGTAYTPSAVTLDWAGSLNQGQQVFTLPYGGTNQAYSLIGNPYASPIDLSLLTRGSNINANFSVWNPSASTKGAYVTQAFSSSYILPSGSAFFTQSGGNTNNTITFTEASKSTGAPSNLFRTNNGKEDELSIRVTDMNDQYADQLTFYFSNTDRAYSRQTDILWDAIKPMNPEVNLYSYSMNGDRLAIDRRPIQANDTIQLGLSQIAVTGTYKFKIEQKSTANTNGIQLYLRDKWKQTETLLNDQLQILVEVQTNEAASQGMNRFELIAKQAPVLTSISNSFNVSISPNPTSDIVKVSFSNEVAAATTITITDAAGKQVRIVNTGTVLSGQASINVKGLAKGMYYVTLDNGSNRRTEKLIVE